MTRRLNVALILFSVFLFPVFLTGQKTPGEVADEIYGFREYKFDKHVSEFSILKDMEYYTATKNEKTYSVWGSDEVNIIVYGAPLYSLKLTFYKDRLYKVNIKARGGSVARGFARALGIRLVSNPTRSQQAYAYGKLVMLSVSVHWTGDNYFNFSNIRFEKIGIKKLVTEDKKRDALDEF